MDDTLRKVMDKLFVTHYHRVWITDHITHKPAGVIALTDVFAFVSDAHDKIEEDGAEEPKR